MSDFDLLQFVPFRLNRLASEVSSALSEEYRVRFGLEIPEWRVLATLGFRRKPSSAQYISRSTRTHKSTISRAVLEMEKRELIRRVDQVDDRRANSICLTEKGRALYEELVPRLQRREDEILACLTGEERRILSALLGKIEANLGLPATMEADD
ncbi:MarR family winged helix-turn-helix transcriptional regulator [Tardiphaga sp. 42S5]|uniref:MarR family winged helix-turn-helix transcriptional regulator n=1 Tax=Tardiphaga sp. 42S5 TaxID=1404799 RepID=UPI002A5A8FE6|nr:MarR family transcriptional regulator [Tardiphaga sp. 42S5]WPO43235.1 MarR family transcriptional regulator [Tardiphaga sp. 42S5]